MRAGISNAVRGIVGSRQILVILVEEGKLEHLHTREAGIREKFSDVRGDKSEVLGDDLSLWEGFLYRPKELNTRGRVPLAVSCGRLTVWDVVVAGKSAEVVYS